MGFGKALLVNGSGTERRMRYSASGGSGRGGRSRRCWSRCGRVAGGSRCGGRGSGGTAACHIHNQAAFGYFIAHFDVHGGNGTGGGGGHVHGGFVGFQRNQGIVYRYGVAHFDFYCNHIHIIVTADIGHGNLYAAAAGGRSTGSSWSRCRLGSFSCGCGGSSSSAFHQHNHAAFGYFAAHAYFNFFHHAGGVCRYVHGGFVGFQGD